MVLAGAPLSGLAQRVRDDIPVPVVDCAEAAVTQVESLVKLDTKPPSKGTYRRPDAKPTSGLTPGLAARIEHTDG